MVRGVTCVFLLALSSSAVAATPPHPASRAKGAVATKPATFYEFKGARLGMSLAEWKALPPPAKSDGVSYSAVCDSDAAAKEHDLLGYASNTPVEKAANVLTCGYYGIGSYGIWVQASVPIGELSASAIYYKFLDGKLYEIEVNGNIDLLSNVLDGLTAKWGQPSSVVHDTTQNKAGATFPHTIQTWKNPVAVIRVEAPYSQIDDLNVTYETLEGLNKLSALDKSINPDADKM